MNMTTQHSVKTHTGSHLHETPGQVNPQTEQVRGHCGWERGRETLPNGHRVPVWGDEEGLVRAGVMAAQL